MLGLDKVPRTPSGTAVLTSDLLPNLAALRFDHVDVASLPLNTTPEHPAAHERTVRVTANNVPGAEPGSAWSGAASTSSSVRKPRPTKSGPPLRRAATADSRLEVS